MLSKLKLNKIDFKIFQKSDRENDIDSNANICETEICAKDSDSMLNSMDQTIDPCENFYEFACGKYLREKVLEEDQIIDSEFSKIQIKVSKQLAAAFAEDIQPNELKCMKLAKQFTKMCMDEKGRDEHGVNPLLKILEKFGGWPVTKANKWNTYRWNWLDAHKQTFEDGLNSNILLEFSIGAHYQNSSKRVIYVSFLRLFQFYMNTQLNRCVDCGK